MLSNRFFQKKFSQTKFFNTQMKVVQSIYNNYKKHPNFRALCWLNQNLEEEISFTYKELFKAICFIKENFLKKEFENKKVLIALPISLLYYVTVLSCFYSKVTC
jgi:acyl-coenzyme A synthetase/AMP-(fatty) acid ligase